MKVIIVNGSPHEKDQVTEAIGYFLEGLGEDIDHEIINLGDGPVQSCVDCGKCEKLHKCVFEDDLCNSLIEKIEAADGLVLASPVYANGPSGNLVSLMTRVMRAGAIRQKVCGTIVTMRRTGETLAVAALESLLYSGGNCFLVSSSGSMIMPEDNPAYHEEGKDSLIKKGLNMAYLIKVFNSYQGEKPVRSDYIWR